MTVAFKILFWKNFLTEKRMWPFFLAELCAIVLIGILVIANPSRDLKENNLTENEKKSIRLYALGDLKDLAIVRSMIEVEDFPTGLVYTPDTASALDMTKAVANQLELVPTANYEPNGTFAMVTIVDGSDTNDNKFIAPNSLTLRIRFPGYFRTYSSSRDESRMWLTRCTGLLTNSLDDVGNYTQTDLYIREGFLQIQELYFENWFQKKSDLSFTVEANSFRYDTTHKLCQPAEGPNVLSLLYYFMYFLPFVNLVWKYGREREENMLAHHWRYGCSKFKYWLSHFVVSYFHLLLLSFVLVILTYVSWLTKPEKEYSNKLDIAFLFCIILLNIAELIISAMVIVSLVPYATNAVYFSILLWILLYAVFAVVLELSYEVKSAWVIFALVTFFNNGFAYGMRYLEALSEEGAKEIWVLFVTMTMSIILKMFFLSIVQYLKPGRYMNRGSYTFLGLRGLLCKCCKSGNKGKSRLKKLRLKTEVVNIDNYQFGPLFGQRLLIATRIYKAMKTFGKPLKDVVKSVSLTIYQGEITVLLGHNGCGKTTLLTMFAGWRKPDEGTILFEEKFNILLSPKAIRKADISMPNNALFDYLTVPETLRYFVRVKGKKLRKEQFQEEIKNWLKTMRSVLPPEDAKRKLVHELSFEQKRLLTLCCVLSCRTKIVLLDEPTLHMRTPEQRLYWSILQREKAHRAIIITTYSFREAETIGDRIAILTDGVLKAYGTPMFLKTTFGIGFDLIILKEKELTSEPITQAIQDFIPDVRPYQESPDQLVYKISQDKRAVFQAMLINLQKYRAELGIIDTKLLTTDLSEVYMSLGRVKVRQVIPDHPQNLTVEYLSKRGRIEQQWKAMFFKKFTHQPKTIIPTIVCLSSFLLIFLLAAMLDGLARPQTNDSQMVLGYPKDASDRYLSNMKNCKFIGIKKVQVGSTISRERTHSFTFSEDSFFCSQTLDFTDYIYKSSDKDIQYLYGALGILKDNRYELYINQHIFHSAPLVLNLFQNYLLEKSLPLERDAIAHVILDPQPVPTPHSIGILDNELQHLYLPLIIGIVIPLTICTFMFALAEERKQNILIMMAIAGLRVDIYWLVNLIWDWATYFIYSILFQIVLIIALYNDLGFVYSWYVLLVNNFYSIPALGSIYFISMFKFFSHYRAYLVACLVHVLSGLFAFVIFWNVFLAENWFRYVLMLSPSFAMLDGVSNIYVLTKFRYECENRCNNLEVCALNDICGTLPECCEYNFFQWGDSGIIRSLVFLTIATVIVIILMCWVEIHRRENKFYVNSKVKKMFTKTYPYDDDDIVRMRDKIARAELRTIARQRLVVDQVEGFIPQNSKYLTTISFEVEKKSILAVYGTQHVGKTHLCRQIIGEDSFRFGDIYIRGIPIKYNMHNAWLHLGYSPQMDGVFTGFTPIEVFHFFCMLRGVPSNGIPVIVKDLGSLFGLGNVMRRQIGSLTKSTQRKVTIATAFIASNKVIVLDEPTRGLPQWTKREIWNALAFMRSCGKAIIITTSDMYECDALADQVLLIDDGEMLAFGGPHYLRHKHVVGFYLEVRLRRDGPTMEEVEENLRLDIENLHRFMIFMHSESIMLHRIDNCLKFYLPVEKVNFNLLYGSLEKNRVRLNIAEYTVSQGNFEEVLSNISSKREHKNVLRLN